MICLYYRWKISNAIDDGVEISSPVQKHVERCSECRMFLNHAIQLENGLLGKRRLTLNGLQIKEFVPVPRDQHKYLRYAVAAVLLIGTLAGLTWKIISSPTAKTEQPIAVNPITELRKIWLEIPVSESGKTMVSALPVTDYYHRELSSLSRDAQSAMQFVSECAGVNLEKLAFLIENRDTKDSF